MKHTPDKRFYHGPGGSVSWMKPDEPKTVELQPKPDIKVRLKMACIAILSAAKDIVTASRRNL